MSGVPEATGWGGAHESMPTAVDPALWASYLVHGSSTIPAAMMLEFAARAGAATFPDAVLSFASDLRVRRLIGATDPSGLRTSATAQGPGQLTVELGDQHGAGMSVTLHYGRRLRQDWQPGGLPVRAATRAATRAAVDPYREPGCPLELGGVWSALANPQLGPGRTATAVFRPPSHGWPEGMRDYRVPFVTVDALARLAASAQSSVRPTADIIAGIARVDFFTSCNDVELTWLFGELDIVVARAPDGQVLTVLAPDGRVLLRAHAITARPVAYLDAPPRVESREVR